MAPGGRCSGHGEAGQDEVAVIVSARPPLGQRRIREHLQADAGDARQACGGADAIRLGGRRGTAREDGRVRLARQHRAVRGPQHLRIERRPAGISRTHRTLPLALRGIDVGAGRLELRFQTIQLRLQRRPLRRLFRRGQIELRLRNPVIAALLSHHGVVAVVEEGEQPVVIALRERVVLVVVALRAGDRGSEPDGAGRVDAIDEGLPARFLDVDAPFLVEQRVAMEPRRDALCGRGVRQHVAGELLGRELIERHVED